MLVRKRVQAFALAHFAGNGRPELVSAVAEFMHTANIAETPPTDGELHQWLLEWGVGDVVPRLPRLPLPLYHHGTQLQRLDLVVLPRRQARGTMEDVD